MSHIRLPALSAVKAGVVPKRPQIVPTGAGGARRTDENSDREARETIKKIGTQAPHELEAMLGAHIFLELNVSVRPNWRQSDIQAL